MQKLAESGAGLESEGASEALAPRGLSARTDNDVERAKDRGPLGGLHDGTSLGGADGGCNGSGWSRSRSVGGALGFAAGGGKRLVDAAYVAKSGASVAAEATTAGGVEGTVAAASVLGFVGSDAWGGLDAKPELYLPDETFFTFD